ncbi:MAG: hypothetical protein GY802_01375 [Gammaproteobacteria bacterium]|nr:hypothetical protein [Gammaproteobacteria bacterium]
MPSTPRILDNLPSLYRPEPGYDDDDLLLQLATAIGTSIDELSSASAEVMQAHWVNYADSAIYSSWLGRRRTLNNEGALKLDDPEIDRFPYLDDLPRIASMVDLAPWRDPLRDRERVETFRRRIHRIVALHRNGLGTPAALRTMTMAALPQVDPDAPRGLRERSFTIEEFSGHTERIEAAQMPGVPSDMVGPLMRWQLDSGSLAPVSPIVVIEGVTPISDQIDPTSQPVIERFDPTTGTGIGIHYQGDLAPGQALALVPGYSSWLGTAGGIDRSDANPQQIEAVNPTASGPWIADGSAPAANVVDIAQTEDHCLWAAVNSADGELWRHDGSGWILIIGGLPQLHCLLADSGQLLVGSTNGFSRLDIQPETPHALIPDPVGLSDPAVHALAVDASGTLWAATALGLAQVESNNLVFSALGQTAATQTPLHCLHIDTSGALYCGGELGLFLHRPQMGQWYLLTGEAADEAVNDWLELDLGATDASLPNASAIQLPAVHAVTRHGVGEIWLGTAQGIARYRAREQRRTYTTLLEAMPRLGEQPVHDIAHDARGRLWFATGGGLLLFDDMDWFQRQGDALVRLPRQAEEQDHPVFWRYLRDTATWQSFAPPDRAGFQNHSETLQAIAESAIHCIAWTSSAHARLGSFDGSSFTVDESATPATLGMRYKPDALRIIDGGIAAVPLLPAGVSDWRYLQREEASPALPGSNPAWTREGRLLPPPGASSAPFEGRYLGDAKGAESAVFAFCPAARVWTLWRPRASLAVTVRLARHSDSEQIDPQILDRVWRELQRVKPAAVPVLLAVEETIERGV